MTAKRTEIADFATGSSRVGQKSGSPRSHICIVCIHSMLYIRTYVQMYMLTCWLLNMDWLLLCGKNVFLFFFGAHRYLDSEYHSAHFQGELIYSFVVIETTCWGHTCCKEENLGNSLVDEESFCYVAPWFQTPSPKVKRKIYIAFVASTFDSSKRCQK